jgi:hypothetical protein
MAFLELTTLERVKAYGTFTTVTPANDALLSDMIKSVSQRFEDYCSRPFLKTSYTETRILKGSRFPLLCTPVDSITSVKVAESGRRADLVLIASSQYEIAPDKNAVNVWDIASGSLVEAVFVGGLAADTASLITAYPALDNACRLQVTSLFKRHTMPDRTQTDLGNGSTSWIGEYDLLKEVTDTLDQQYSARHRFL